MINVSVNDVDFSDVGPNEKKLLIEPEIEKEVDHFKEHWSILGLSPMLPVEEATVRTYLRWRLVKG